MDYNILKPRKDFLILKEVETKDSAVLIKSGQDESRAIGRIVSIPDGMLNWKIGDLVVYNEYEGQELFKFGPIDEDKIIVIKEENVLLRIDESNLQSNVQQISEKPTTSSTEENESDQPAN